MNVADNASNNPYPGLRPFDCDFEEYFKGRDRQVDQIVRILKGERFVSIVGVSGCGKSSLIHAGLIPKLHEGQLLPIPQRKWLVVTTTPYGDPWGNLDARLVEQNIRLEHLPAPSSQVKSWPPATALIEAVRRALAAAKGEQNAPSASADGEPAPEAFALLLVVDQFEEIFHSYQGAVPPGAVEFVRMLIWASRQDVVPIYIVLSLRSDFIGDCARFRDLPDKVDCTQFLVPRMTRNEMVEAITQPALAEDWKVCDNLVEKLIADTGDDPDRLPFLQHVLNRLWEVAHDEAKSKEGQPREITLRHYESIGIIPPASVTEDSGVITGGPGEKEPPRFALDRHVEGVYQESADHVLHDKELGPKTKLYTERLFRFLTQRESGQRHTRVKKTFRECAQMVFAPVGAEENWAPSAEQTEFLASIIDQYRGEGRWFLRPYHVANKCLKPDDLIDLTHESLILGWIRLRRWVEQERHEGAEYHWLLRASDKWKNQTGRLLTFFDLRRFWIWQKEIRLNHIWAKRYGGRLRDILEYVSRSREHVWLKIALGSLVAAVVSVVLIFLVVKLNSAKKDAELSADNAAKSEKMAQESARDAREKAKVADRSTQIAKVKEQEAKDSAKKARDEADALELKNAENNRLILAWNKRRDEQLELARNSALVAGGSAESIHHYGSALRADGRCADATSHICSSLAKDHWLRPLTPNLGVSSAPMLAATVGPDQKIYVVTRDGWLMWWDRAKLEQAEPVHIGLSQPVPDARKGSLKAVTFEAAKSLLPQEYRSQIADTDQGDVGDSFDVSSATINNDNRFPGQPKSQKINLDPDFGKNYPALAFLNAAFSDDGKHLVVFHVPRSVGINDKKSAEVNPTFQLWNWNGSDYEAGTVTEVPDRAPFHNVTWQRDGKKLLLSRWDAPYSVLYELDEQKNFDFTSWSRRSFQSIGMQGPCFSPDEQGIAAADNSKSNEVLLFDARTGARQKSLVLDQPLPAKVSQMVYGPGGHDLAVVGWGAKSNLSVFDAHSGARTQLFEASDGSQVMKVLMAPMGSANSGKMAILLNGRVDIRDEAELDKRVAHAIKYKGANGFASFTTDGTKLLTWSGPSWGSFSSVRLWSLKMEEPIEWNDKFIDDNKDPTPEWLPDLADAVTGQGGGSSEDGDIYPYRRTLEEFIKHYADVKPTGVYKLIWDRYFDSEGHPK